MRNIQVAVLKVDESLLSVVDGSGMVSDAKAASFEATTQPNPQLRSRSGRLLALLPIVGEGPMAKKVSDVALADLATPEARSVALDAFTLDRPKIHDELGFGEHERSWWRAVHAWRAGDEDDCLSLLLGLPDNYYAPRVALFLAASDAAFAKLNPVSVARTFSGSLASAPELELARLLVLQRADDSSVSDKHLSEAAVRLKGFNTASGDIGEVAAGQLGDGDAARLLGALLGDRNRLGPDPHVLDHASQVVIDDLVDSGVIPSEWASPGAVGDNRDYLQARLQIGALPDDSLRHFEADLEIVRRAIARGDAIPEGASDDAVLRFAPLARLAAGGTATATEIADLTSLDPVEVVATFENPNLVPAEELLADGALSRLLEARSTVLPSTIDPGNLGPNQRQYLGQVLLERTRRRLFAWQWEEALADARECLRFAQLERQRDEALNMLAAAHWELGNDQEALKALTVALEDDYTESLLTNVAVVASELEPEMAAARLAQLVSEAPSLELRVAAARRAMMLWATTDEPWAQEEALPIPIRDALRDVLVQDISESDFIAFLRLLAARDEEWLSSKDALVGSPHRQSDAAKVWTARARDLEEFVVELGRVLRTGTPVWADQERNSILQAALDALVVEDPSPGSAFFGMLLLDKNLPLDPDDAAVLRAFVARAVALSIDLDEGEPAEKFLDWLEVAKSDLGRMDAKYRERAENAIGVGFRSLAFAYYQARLAQLEEVAKLHDAIFDRIRYTPRRRTNRDVVRNAAAPGQSFCVDTIALVDRLIPNVEGDLEEALQELKGQCREIAAALVSLSR
jgi:tetratricopeptide (TPR) repeat protein